MNEIHIKFKPFVIGLATVFFLFVYLVSRSPECPPALNASIANAYQQQVPQKTQSPQPFTIYAITPTYARPVQKAELTRYGQTSGEMMNYKISSKLFPKIKHFFL